MLSRCYANHRRLNSPATLALVEWITVVVRFQRVELETKTK